MIRSIRAEHKRTEDPLLYGYNIHTHDEFEMVYFVHGDADFVAEGNVYHLKKGDVVISGKSESHFLNVRSSAYYERIVIVFDLEDAGDNLIDRNWCQLMKNKPLGERNRFPAAVFGDRHWHYYMERICSCKTADEQNVYLRLMLLELAEAYEKTKTEPDSAPPSRAAAVIAYVNRNLYNELSLDALCSRFFLSKSQLNRIFRQATGSTVWNYIMVKRLLRARELLRAGENPTAVCEKCAFRNYVSFYKAYQKHFGHSPKEDHRQKENGKETACQRPE